jgi:hypothetical protein
VQFPPDQETVELLHQQKLVKQAVEKLNVLEDDNTFVQSIN